MAIELERYRQIVVLTGAGISVASGLRPYRGPGGLWNDASARALAEPGALEREPRAVWQMFGALREQLRSAEPNAAHIALATAEDRLRSDQQITVITQNIDGLHQRAGSRRVIELHGSAYSSRCANAACSSQPFEDHATYAQGLAQCAQCGGLIRPDLVLFGEPLPARAEWECKRLLRDCDLFMSVGTSGSVSPASNFVRGAEYAGARTIYVNLEAMDPPHPGFQETYLGRAETLLPTLLGIPVE